MPFITPAVLAGILAFVVEIMIFISFDELIYLTFRDDDGHNSITGITIGMAIMALTLYFI